LPDPRLVGEPHFYCGWLDIVLARDFLQAAWEAS